MSRKIKIIPGFQFAGVTCGIKPRSQRDLALIYSEVPATVVGTFTQHPAVAAPVLLSRRQIRSGLARAVVINSGNANACTGKQGERDARSMVQETARVLHVPASRVLVCSTGVIGVPLPIGNIKKGIQRAAKVLSSKGLVNAAKAILTTDRGIKMVTTGGRVGERPFHLIGIAKGAGMIEPHMKVEVRGTRQGARGKHATMLAFLMTDLALDRKWAAQILQEGVEQSFNRISVDGDTSTNDTCLLMANGLAGNRPLSAKQAGARRFQEALFDALQELAHAMVADGEGATKVVAIEVKGAKNQAEAKSIAYSVANSQLVRTSFYGADPNWGRILAAVGNSGATCRPDRVDIYYDKVQVCRKGLDTGPQAQRKAKQVMKKKNFTLTIHCHLGKAIHDLLSSDLTPKYVKLNSGYRS